MAISYEFQMATIRQLGANREMEESDISSSPIRSFVNSQMIKTEHVNSLQFFQLRVLDSLFLLFPSILLLDSESTNWKNQGQQKSNAVVKSSYNFKL